MMRTPRSVQAWTMQSQERSEWLAAATTEQIYASRIMHAARGTPRGPALSRGVGF